ncbi:tonsoku-like protein [Esox lucius]|uniref:Tonsoku-like protein n=1 Tax=Esox lucius TaxID=8010 RepID=A0A6Q2X4Q2_ESOLU|nr:tonsoku-like protein [Esox lucius]
MSAAREIKQLQKAKSKAQSSNNFREEASLCNQLGEVLSRNGDYEAAIEEHRQELQISTAINDVIGRAVANRKIGECYAEMGNIEAALRHQRCHLDLARSVSDHAEEQRALATIGRTFLFRYESDSSKESLRQAEDAFRKSMDIVDSQLEGTVSNRELSEMRARLYLNLGLVCDHLGEPKRCSEYIRLSVYIAEKNQLLEDLYRANFNLGNIYFRNGRHSNAMRSLEQAKECARKIKDKFIESECFHSIGKVQLSLGDFVAARRSLKKAFSLGSQHAVDREAVKKAFKQAIRGGQLEEALGDLGGDVPSQEAVGLAEQLGDLYCKVGCYSKALDAYHMQLSRAEALGKPARELAVIHVSLAATYTDLRRYDQAVEHYRQELALRHGNPKEECKTWLTIAAAQEESGKSLEEVDISYDTALRCAQRSCQAKLQSRVLKAWLAAQRRCGLSQADDTQARLEELRRTEGWSPEGGSEGEEDEDETENSEQMEDSDIELSDSDDDLEEYDKMVSGGRRKPGRWNKRNEKGETSLHRACIDGNLRQVQFLLEQGHPVNPRDYCGWTPLHEACNHGHTDVVALLLDRGANINDPGGSLCEGVTPLHDALTCGHFQVARVLVERGASVTLRNSKGETALDSLRLWQRMYSRELDQEARQELSSTEKLLRRALAGLVTAVPVPPKPCDALQDSQLFDAENSEPLIPTRGRHPSTESLPRTRSPKDSASPRSPTQRHCNGTPRPPQRHRGTEASVLFGHDSSSSSDHSDLDASVSPLRPVRPRRFPAAPTPQDVAPSQEVSTSVSEVRATGAPPAFGREEYHSAIRSLGSAKSRLLAENLSQPQFSSTPAISSNGRPALVPEEEYLIDDWLEDDMGDVQPKKRRRVGGGPNGSWGSSATSSAAGTRIRHSDTTEPANSVLPSSRKDLSPMKTTSSSSRPRQVKMTQLSGMVRLGRREVSRSQSPTASDDVPRVSRPPQNHPDSQQVPQQPVGRSMPAPIRMRVRVQDNVFLIPVPHSEADSCTVLWLCEQASQRYYQACGLLPRLSLQKEGALLSPQDLLLAVLHSNEEVLAEVSSWDLPPLPERYKKACHNLAVEESKRVLRLCEVQDGSPSVSLCGLSLPPSSLTPVLRALKLQAGLTQLRLSGNRLHDHLFPELVAAAVTMPRLRLLDVSSNDITGEGLKKAANALAGQPQPAFPCLEEWDLSVNPLGDGLSQALSCLLSACPLLASLSLQACNLTARCLQLHRLLLAGALAGTGHLKSVNLSHNALGSTGFELVLKTLPLHCLTHLHLSAIRCGSADQPSLEQLMSVLSQGECSLTHLSLAGNGLTDGGMATLARCLLVCPSIVSLDLSGNPAVTSAGLHSLLSALRDAQRPLTYLNLQGCQVVGPWDSAGLDGLSELVQDLRLCSQRLNKLDREMLQQTWGSRPGVRFLSRDAKCLLTAAPSL